VWSAVGEEFVCPNCGNPLVPPGSKSLSWRGIRRAAVLGVLLLTVVAASGFAAVRLSPLAVSAARPVLAALWTAPHKLMTAHIFGVPASPAALPHGTPDTAVLRVTGGQPPARGIATPAPRPAAMLLASGVATLPDDHRVAAPIVLYSAPVQQQPKPSPGKTAPHALAPAAQGQVHQAITRPDEPASAVPAAVVTVLAEANLVAPPSEQAPVILPVTFGRPMAPENDAEPVRMHWRYHGLVAAAAPRRSVFRTAPTDPIEAMCRTLEPLQ
jgi:hypothetical protein